MERSYRHVGYYFLLIVPLVLVAFFRTYIVYFPEFDVNVPKLIHAHAVFATIWIIMLIAQPFLIINKKYSWHRAIGKVSYVVFPLLILTFVPRIIEIVSSGDLKGVTLPVGDAVVMSIFYSLAIYHRKDTGKHMRYIIASSLPLIGPTIGRIGPIYFEWSAVATETLEWVIIFGVLFGLILYDRKHSKNYMPYTVAVCCFAIYAVAFYIIYL